MIADLKTTHGGCNGYSARVIHYRGPYPYPRDLGARTDDRSFELPGGARKYELVFSSCICTIAHSHKMQVGFLESLPIVECELGPTFDLTLRVHRDFPATAMVDNTWLHIRFVCGRVIHAPCGVAHWLRVDQQPISKVKQVLRHGSLATAGAAAGGGGVESIS